MRSYTLPLSGFTLQTACGFATAAQALAGGVTQVNVLVVGSNIQYLTPDGGGVAGGVYPNGLNLGKISFD